MSVLSNRFSELSEGLQFKTVNVFYAKFSRMRSLPGAMRAGEYLTMPEPMIFAYIQYITLSAFLKEITYFNMIISYLNRCWSYVGRTGGKQRLSLGVFYWRHGIITHEIGEYRIYMFPF